MSSQEARQRRAASILILLGSILLMVVTWNYSPGRGGEES